MTRFAAVIIGLCAFAAPHVAQAQTSAMRALTGQTAVDRSSAAARATYAEAVALDRQAEAAVSAKSYGQADTLRQQAFTRLLKACDQGNRLACEDATDGVRLMRYFPTATSAKLEPLVGPARERLRAIMAGECRQGFVDTCIDYQRDYGEDDPKTALPVLDARCAKEDAAACYAIGRKPPGEAARVATALAAARAGCDKGIGQNCTELARYYASEVDGHDPALTRRYAERGCKLDDQRGCLFFGQVVLGGIGGPVDRDLAARTFKSACDKGYTAACRYATALQASPTR